MRMQAAKTTKPTTAEPLVAHKPAGSPIPIPRKSVAPEEIRVCAYYRWIAAGRPATDGVQFWLEAEKLLLQGIK
jgi:Protein of unknown function (DUF2934)